MLVQGAIYNQWNGMVEWNTEMSNFKLVAFINNGFCLGFSIMIPRGCYLMQKQFSLSCQIASYTVATQMSFKQCDK